MRTLLKELFILAITLSTAVQATALHSEKGEMPVATSKRSLSKPANASKKINVENLICSTPKTTDDKDVVEGNPYYGKKYNLTCDLDSSLIDEEVRSCKLFSNPINSTARPEEVLLNLKRGKQTREVAIFTGPKNSETLIILDKMPVLKARMVKLDNGVTMECSIEKKGDGYQLLGLVPDPTL
ncbi:MAG: hypothetical protein EXR74_06905 [Bdellovibrionales bacterium]|nr:hypothetical protein [Bdellovibrionales bacterium]